RKLRRGQGSGIENLPIVRDRERAALHRLRAGWRYVDDGEAPMCHHEAGCWLFYIPTIWPTMLKRFNCRAYACQSLNVRIISPNTFFPKHQRATASRWSLATKRPSAVGAA